MNHQGVLIGFISFVAIGLFHPIVIKAEYYFSKKIWPVFLLAGMALLVISLCIQTTLTAALVGVVGFSCLWSIIELFQQEKRVKRGWFPANPKRASR